MVNSFSLVATEEVKQEAAILIFALRKFHHQPVYVLCDTPTKTLLDTFDFTDVDLDVDADPPQLAATAQDCEGVATANTFHRVDCIAKKMDALERATFMYGNTLFLDADIVPVASIDLDITHRVMVSPHYHGFEPEKNVRIYGAYNAGYVFNAEPDLPDLWRDIYYTPRSKFFEQEGMIYFHEKFDVGKFDKAHNIGFWRFELENGSIKAPQPAPIKSYHAHLTNNLFALAETWKT